jgi:hypothetical protein
VQVAPVILSGTAILYSPKKSAASFAHLSTVFLPDCVAACRIQFKACMTRLGEAVLREMILASKTLFSFSISFHFDKLVFMENAPFFPPGQGLLHDAINCSAGTQKY